MKILAGVLLAALVVSGAVFEVAGRRGLTFVQQNSPTGRKYLPETMGGGVALLDYNGDGLLDVFLVNGGFLEARAGAAVSFRRSEPKYWNRLFRQNADHSFTDVTAAAGLGQAGDGNYGMGVAAADFDGDGLTDLYVTSYGANRLYRTNGDGTFSDVTAKAGVGGGGWSVSAGFFDFDNDGRLDLFVTRYMEWSLAASKVCARETYCAPGEFPATTSLLYRNRGDGTFEDVSEKAGISAKKGRALGVAFADYDGDGLTDVFVANDGMEQFLFHNEGGGRFAERALEAGVALSDDGKPVSGMGVDFRDYDNDGRPDVVVTDLARQVYAVFHNDGGGAFSYVSQAVGMSVLSAGSSGWGVRWEDFDNDGWKDLFVAQGHVMDNVAQVDPTLHYLEAPLVAMNRAGHFERASSGADQPVAGRGAAFGDLNNDGAMDVVMTVLGGQPTVLQGKPGKNHWLTLTLRGTRSNRDGFGAVVRVNGQSQTVSAAGSYVSSSDKRVHFGLGAAKTATVDIEWPSGRRQRMADVQADQFIAVTEPEK